MDSRDLSNGENGSHELLQAQAHVWNHIFNYINSMSLKCAVDLGIPDIIHKHGDFMTISELVAALPIHPSKSNHLFRLMRILVNSGFFDRKNLSEEGEEGYVLNHCSRLLLKDNPLSVHVAVDPIRIKPWHVLSTWFQNEDVTPFDTAHGMSCWDYCTHHPNFAKEFYQGMVSDSLLVSSVVIDKCKWVFEGLKSLVDVAGGTGTMARAIAKAFPDVDCTVLDLPQVVAGLRDTGNLKFHGGDMFETIPPANAILLKWILHDWSDEECVKILKKCKEAIISHGNGKVIIIDMVIENQRGDEKSIETQLFFDMNMMIMTSGKERNEKEWANLFLNAEFTDYKITPILGLRSLIEVYP